MSTHQSRTSAGRASRRLTFEDAVEVHHLLAAGEIQSRIAAMFDVNQGRIADVKKGRLHPGSREAYLAQLLGMKPGPDEGGDGDEQLDLRL